MFKKIAILIQILIQLFNPLTPNIKDQILLSYPHTFLIKVLERNYSKLYQENSPWVIISLILMTSRVEQALILQGESWCWSLLGLKGLMLLVIIRFFNFMQLVRGGLMLRVKRCQKLTSDIKQSKSKRYQPQENNSVWNNKRYKTKEKISRFYSEYQPKGGMESCLTIKLCSC